MERISSIIKAKEEDEHHKEKTGDPVSLEILLFQELLMYIHFLSICNKFGSTGKGYFANITTLADNLVMMARNT